jgi:signal peptidase I
MSATAQGRVPVTIPVTEPVPATTPAPALHLHLPTVPEAFASLLRTLIVALFLLSFVLQPFLIPSESMERTLLVGDFLLVNKQIFAPAGKLTRWIMPYREIQRGDIVVFHHPRPPLLVKRVIGLPGDRIRIEDGRVWVNDMPLNEPYAAFEPAAFNPARDNFPASVYSDPSIDLDWWRQMRNLVHNGELVVPAGEYFVLGDNRNHSDDSRFWGLVPRNAIVARPLVIYFSLRRPSTTDVEQAPDDRLTHDRELTARLADFARWNRIFHVIH